MTDERAPTPVSERHHNVKGERAIATCDERAPIANERAPTVHNGRACTADERAPIVDDGRALERSGKNLCKFDGGDGRAPIGDGERDPVPFRDEHRNVIGKRALDTYKERASMTDTRVALDGDGTTPAVNREMALMDGGEWASCIQVTVCDPDRADLQLKAKRSTLPKMQGIRRSPVRG